MAPPELIVLTSLLPVMALVLLGLAIGRARWLGPATVRHLSTLAFMVLTPILLFRAMSRVHVQQLDLLPALVYALALALVFAGMLRQHGLSQRAAVLALAATYGNAVMIGIPLVGLAFGEAGLVALFTLMPVHSLLLLTSAIVSLRRNCVVALGAALRLMEPAARAASGHRPRACTATGRATGSCAPARTASCPA